MLKFVAVNDYGNVSLTAAPQTQSTKSPLIYGTITALTIENTTNATGTLSTAQAISNIIQDLVIEDSSNNQICDLAGVDIPYLAFALSNHGVFTASATATAGTNETDNYVLNWTIALKDQPVYIKLTLAPYSVLASSGATGGTADVKISAWYEDNPQAPVSSSPTFRLSRFDQGIANGTTTLNNYLGQGLSTTHLMARVTDNTESAFTSVTIRATAQTQIESQTLAELTSQDTNAFQSGHQTGFFVFPVSPFVPSGATVYQVVGSASKTLRTFQFYVS